MRMCCVTVSLGDVSTLWLCDSVIARNRQIHTLMECDKRRQTETNNRERTRGLNAANRWVYCGSPNPTASFWT